MNLPTATASPVLLLPDEPQYALRTIGVIWMLSALPMGLLAFVVTPALVPVLRWPSVLVYWLAVDVGLVWQFVLVVGVLRVDGYALTRATLRDRLWYRAPRDPRTGRKSYRLLLWTLPFIALSAGLQTGVGLPIPDVDGLLVPHLASLPTYDLSSVDPATYRGAWWLVPIYGLTALFNYLLGEEMIYRGVLLPRMRAVFGRWDWFANGILFGCYHLHKPQVLLSTALVFGFVFAFPSLYFQSSWMAFIIHGLEGVLGLAGILAIVSGRSG